MLRTLIFIYLTLNVSAPVFAELTVADRRKIDELKRNETELASELFSQTLSPAVDDYFRLIIDNPDKIREILGQGTEPIPFRKFLVKHAAENANAIPETLSLETRKKFALCVIAAFRDRSESGEFRVWAYKYFRYRVYPRLSPDLANSVKYAISQYAGKPEFRQVAIPALILLAETTDTVAENLEKTLTLNDTELTLRTLEVLQKNIVDEDKLNDSRVQQLIAKFLMHKNHRIRETAINSLVDPQRSNIAEVNLLTAEAEASICEALKDNRSTPNTLIAGIRVLTKDNRKPWFSNISDDPQNNINQTIAKLLHHQDSLVREAALDFFKGIKTGQEEIQMQLVEIAFQQSKSESGKAFHALGLHAPNEGEKRIRSEAVRSHLAQGIIAALQLSHISRERASRIAAASELLRRNQSRYAEVYLVSLRAFVGIAHKLANFPDSEGVVNLQDAQSKLRSLLLSEFKTFNLGFSESGWSTLNLLRKKLETNPVAENVAIEVNAFFKKIYDSLLPQDLLAGVSTLKPGVTIPEELLQTIHELPDAKFKKLFATTLTDDVMARLLREDTSPELLLRRMITCKIKLGASFPMIFRALFDLLLENEKLAPIVAQMLTALSRAPTQVVNLPINDQVFAEGLAAAIARAGRDENRLAVSVLTEFARVLRKRVDFVTSACEKSLQ